MNDDIEDLLERMSDRSAERAARWLLWSLVARRLSIALVAVLRGLSHLLR